MKLRSSRRQREGRNLKKNGDKAKRVWGKMKDSRRKRFEGGRKTSVEEREVFKSCPFYILLLSESELGIPKRRKSSSKLAASLFVSKETSCRMAQKLTDCTVEGD
jgi:hypothetical protein